MYMSSFVCRNVRPSSRDLSVFSRDTCCHQVSVLGKCANDSELSVCTSAHMSWNWSAGQMSAFAAVMENLGRGCLQDSTRRGIAGDSHLRFPLTPTGATWVQTQGSRHGQSPSTSRPVTRHHNGTIAEKRLSSQEGLSRQEEIWHWFLFLVRGIMADKLLWGG